MVLNAQQKHSKDDWLDHLALEFASKMENESLQPGEAKWCVLMMKAAMKARSSLKAKYMKALGEIENGYRDAEQSKALNNEKLYNDAKRKANEALQPNA
jgi:hypothetical protein